ncbi:MAG: hypothetical protein AAGF67_14705 [Verrucomicrobiota bacterium]
MKADEQLVFRTGFEGGLSIVSHPLYPQNHTFAGKDEKSGFDFAQFADQLDIIRFAYVIGGRRQNPEDYVRTVIEPGTGRKGTRGLLMEVADDYSGDEENTRSEFSLFSQRQYGSSVCSAGIRPLLDEIR